ncbi:high frequency lysogenization protein HflD [Gilvimarinus sp. F26214L]|uniref:high frequency lysogenization protein HflD n=1 Tax=Gilvimarinus sp. DZF01 TaxID=3461371 RepID=UPI0040466DD0
MNGKWQNRTIALAGIFQAAALVDRLATTGYLQKEEFRTCVESLLEQNPSSTLATYGGELARLELGLQAMVDSLGGLRRDSTQQCLRYMLGIMHLQQKLNGRNDLLSVIGTRIAQARQQAEHFESTHDNVIANLADLYTDTISTFRFRIHVRGEATYLQQQRVANQVRTLLFAGIRSAMLWHQVGGRRWHVIVYRKRLLAEATELLGQAKPNF